MADGNGGRSLASAFDAVEETIELMQAPAELELEAGVSKLEPAAATTSSSSDAPTPPTAGSSSSSSACDLFAYRADIDGMRAVACAAVVVFHLDRNWLTGGWAGVDMFFVISGYVVSASLLRKRDAAAPPGSRLLAFYARRVKRLTPSLLFVVIATSLATALTVSREAEGAQLDSYYSSGMAGLVGWRNMMWRFNGFADPYGHLWSLVEEQFYLMYPLLLYAAHSARWTDRISRVWSACATDSPLHLMRCIRRERETGAATRAAAARGERAAPTVVLALSMLLSFDVFFMLCMLGREDDWAFFLVFARFWQLASGGLLFQLQLSYPTLWRRSLGSGVPSDGWWCRWVVLATEALAAFVVYDSFFNLPSSRKVIFYGSLRTTAGSLLAIILGSAPRTTVLSAFGGRLALRTPLTSEVLGTRPFVYIGKLSYPIYLWHWPVFIYTERLLKRHGESLFQGERRAGCQLAAVGASFGLAAISYHFAEWPARAWRPRKSWHVFALFLPLIGAGELWLGLLRGPLNQGRLLPAL